MFIIVFQDERKASRRTRRVLLGPDQHPLEASATFGLRVRNSLEQREIRSGQFANCELHIIFLKVYLYKTSFLRLLSYMFYLLN